MNIFVKIVRFIEFKETTFYSVKVGLDTTPLGSQFLKNNSSHPHLNILLTWLKKIGNDRSALEHFFRPEKHACALPPKYVPHRTCSLRWYCLRMRPGTVIVFNGGNKIKM